MLGFYLKGYNFNSVILDFGSSRHVLILVLCIVLTSAYLRDVLCIILVRFRYDHSGIDNNLQDLAKVRKLLQ